jgi:hypothetical protein
MRLQPHFAALQMNAADSFSRMYHSMARLFPRYHSRDFIRQRALSPHFAEEVW